MILQISFCDFYRWMNGIFEEQSKILHLWAWDILSLRELVIQLRTRFIKIEVSKILISLSYSESPNIFATQIGQMGLEMEWFSFDNGVFLIMKKRPSDSPIRQLKKRELLLPLSFLITKPLKSELSNLHYWPHYRTQGCVIRENNITTPLRTPLTPNRPLVHTSLTYQKLNMDEICSLKVYLSCVHTSQKISLKSLHAQRMSLLVLTLHF